MNPRLARYLIGCLFAFMGGHVINFGLVQWAQEVLHAPAWSGALLLLCFGLPVVFGWHGGVLSDRGNPLRVARWAHLAFVAAALLMAFAAWVPWLRRDLLVFAWTAAFIAGLGWSYSAPARLAYLPTLVPPEKVRGAAIAFNVLTTVGFGAAPLVVGAVRQSHPWSVVFLTAVGLIGLSFVCFVGLPFTAKPQDGLNAQTVREGWAYARRTPIIAQLLVASAAAHLLMGPIQVILPRFLEAALAFGPGARGLFLGMAAPSLIAGGMLALSLGRLKHPGRALMLGIVGSASACFSLSFVSTVPLAAALFVAACLCAGSAVAFLAASLQEVSDPAYRGRVMASYAITTQFFPAFSGLLCGLLLAWKGPVSALGIYAACVAVVGLTLLAVLSTLRGYRRG